MSDTVTFAATAAGLVAVALLAADVPTRRVAELEPMAAPRGESL